MTTKDNATETSSLQVQVAPDLVLDAGRVTPQAGEYLLTPPETPLLDQLWDWLADHPRKNYGIHNYALGIGATALCLRWGSYLTVLMDENKPVDPRAAQNHQSMIFDGEMMRINIEASYNLAWLLEKLHQNESETLDYLLRAYDWLPMPQKQVKANWQTYRTIYFILAHGQELGAGYYPERAEQAVQAPYRALANTFISLAYRNGPVENIHAGAGAAYRLHQRRFTPAQTRLVLRHTAEHLSAVMGAIPPWDARLPKVTVPWPQRLAGLRFIPLYPWDWSFEASSAPITLQKEWCE